MVMSDRERCQTVIVQLPENNAVYDWFHSIHTFYHPIHTYLSTALCAIGTLCNFCNIIVLTRKKMRTPVSMILTAMACCDTVVLFSNLIYATHYTFVAFANCHPKHWSYGWAMFLICHAHLSLIGHSSSVWLSVVLAMLRYITLRSKRRINATKIYLRHSYLAIVSVIFFVAIVNAPNFLAYKIIKKKLSEMCNITDERNGDAPAYIPGVSELSLKAHCLVFRMAFWISGIVFKMLPCLLLSLFVWMLLKILTEVQQNRRRLMRDSFASANEQYNTEILTKRTTSSMTARTDHTTRMLLIILFVFLIAEFPQGVMAVLSGMFSEEFRLHIYNSVGDILDLLSLCNACTTFTIYCSMSEQFRDEFKQVFLPFSLCGYSLQNKYESWKPTPLALQSFNGTTVRNGLLTELNDPARKSIT